MVVNGPFSQDTGALFDRQALLFEEVKWEPGTDPNFLKAANVL